MVAIGRAPVYRAVLIRLGAGCSLPGRFCLMILIRLGPPLCLLQVVLASSSRIRRTRRTNVLGACRVIDRSKTRSLTVSIVFWKNASIVFWKKRVDRVLRKRVDSRWRNTATRSRQTLLVDWRNVCRYVCMYICMYVRTYVRTYVCIS